MAKPRQQHPAESRTDCAPLLTANDVAVLLGVSTETLAQWRSQRRGIPFIKIARNVVRYRQCDVEAWLAAHVVRVEH